MVEMERVDAVAVEDEADDARAGRWGKMSPQNGSTGGAGPVYGLGLIGAAVYFFRSAESGRDYALALPKGIVWPAVVVYDLLKAYHR
jgi:hypothetical protein